MTTGVGGLLWGCLGGTEIWNACLTSQLQANGHGVPDVTCLDCAPCCGDLDAALGFAGGRSIAQAPWYSPSEPDSVNFAGLLVTSIEGLSPGNITRSLTEAANIGAVLGQLRQTAPQVVVTGILMGDCCGAEYGLQWLRAALRGSCSSSTLCQGDDFTWLTCEPSTPDLDCPENQPFDYDAWIAPYYRTLKNAALIDGPRVTQRIPRACPSCSGCPMIEVTFTIAAGDPCVYRDPVVVEPLLTFTHLVEPCIQWIPADSDVDCDECPDTANCATDPDCTDTSPPSMPSLTNTCVSTCISGERSRACFDIPIALIPINGEATLELEIFAGDKPLRNVQVIGWHNPLGFPPDDLSDCAACFGLNISYVAPNATLTIDGASRTSMIECVGAQSVRANPFIADGSGSPAFTYPVLEGCASGVYTVCVYANDPVSAQATVRASLVPRNC